VDFYQFGLGSNLRYTFDVALLGRLKIIESEFQKSRLTEAKHKVRADYRRAALTSSCWFDTLNTSTTALVVMYEVVHSLLCVDRDFRICWYAWASKNYLAGVCWR